MSTFYVLPPRPLLGQQFAAFLQGCFPGLTWNRAELAELLGAAAQRQADVYVVFREDLAEPGDVKQTLVEDFGAAAGDEVVEVGAGAARRWWVD
jgi:hypothetical protein